MVIRIFVYGTLKRNYSNHHLMTKAKFIKETRTKDAVFDMVDLGKFPGVLANGNCAVHGELYEIDAETLHHLDELEENGILYRREKIDLIDEKEPVWIYLFLYPKAIQSKKNIVKGLDSQSTTVLRWIQQGHSLDAKDTASQALLKDQGIFGASSGVNHKALLATAAAHPALRSRL